MGRVPHITREYIENTSEKVLRWVNARRITEPGLSPVSEVVEKLVLRKRVAVNFNKPLGHSRRGRKILGMFLFEPPTILIDPALDHNGPRFRFTLAHELGHLALHGKLDLPADQLDSPENGIEDARQHFFFGRKRPLTQRDWLEWQANAFAAALLVPRATVRMAIAAKQKEIGVTRNRGTIFVDEQWQNRSEYGAVMSHIQSVYQTSRTMMRVRLNTLGLLTDTRNATTSHIARHFKALFMEEENELLRV